MDAFPAGTYIYMYIHTYVTWECFSNLETVVTQIEKRTETQPSFNKGSGGPQNKEHNFYANFNHNIKVRAISADGVPH